MAKEKVPTSEQKFSKEVRQIRNLLILIALKSGAASDEVHYATGMGAANIRAMFQVMRGRRKKGTKPVPTIAKQ
ncbi:MAG TPA: hypothetical protein VKV95_17610 [Terriglobia bacterium]|nr:hypothetical protein [Terriglobia bacterium]